MKQSENQECRSGSPVLSVIIPTCDRPGDLRRCLDAAITAEDNANWEMLVSDDSPDPSTLDEVCRDYPAIVWLRGPRRGPAANRNCAAKQARGQWLLFLDDDVVPAPACVDAYLDAIRQESIATVFEGRTVTEAALDPFVQEAPVNRAGGVLPSCNFAIKRAVFESLGGFRECFSHWMEDVDLHRRIKEANIPIRFLPSAEVYHPPRRRPGIMRLAGRWRARVQFERLWGMSVVKLLVWLPWHILRVRMAQYRVAGSPIRSFGASLLETILVSVQLPCWLIVDAKCLANPVAKH